MIRVPEKMISVPEKWYVYNIMYQYFQYSTNYVPEKAVHVPNDLIAYNSAYHHYHLMYRKEREILVQNNCFLVHVPKILVHNGTCTNFTKGSSISLVGLNKWKFLERLPTSCITNLKTQVACILKQDKSSQKVLFGLNFHFCRWFENIFSIFYLEQENFKICLE